jgi:hypothetical protein
VIKKKKIIMKYLVCFFILLLGCDMSVIELSDSASDDDGNLEIEDTNKGDGTKGDGTKGDGTKGDEIKENIIPIYFKSKDIEEGDFYVQKVGKTYTMCGKWEGNDSYYKWLSYTLGENKKDLMRGEKKIGSIEKKGENYIYTVDEAEWGIIRLDLEKIKESVWIEKTCDIARAPPEQHVTYGTGYPPSQGSATYKNYIVGDNSNYAAQIKQGAIVFKIVIFCKKDGDTWIVSEHSISSISDNYLDSLIYSIKHNGSAYILDSSDGYQTIEFYKEEERLHGVKYTEYTADDFVSKWSGCGFEE